MGATEDRAPMSEAQRMEAGLDYRFTDRELGARRRRAISAVERYNQIGALDFDEQERFVAEELFGSAGVGASVQQGFNCDNGRNIHVGDHLIINYGCTVLDVAEVTMGDWVMIGPHVLISTVNHPLSPRGRRNRLGVARPVHIGNDVWIGGGAVVLPGVTIGDNVVVGAGAVVTHDIPSNSLALGVPARVVRQIENDLDGWVEGELLGRCDRS